MATKTLLTPTTDEWLVLFENVNNFVVQYLHIVNLDKDAGSNIALALVDTTLEHLNDPSGLLINPVGGLGSTRYDYVVTALNAYGETGPSNQLTIVTAPAILDESNYHTLSWAPVTGALKYRVYCTVGSSVYVKEVTAPTATVNNDGTWVLGSNPPWLNMTQVVSILLYEQLSPSSLLQMNMEVELTSLERLMFATTNSLISLYARGSSI